MDKPPIHQRVRVSILLAAFCASLSFSVHCAALTIVVAGDGRAEYHWGLKRACDKDGINEGVTRAIAKAASDENASILLWTGDMTNIDVPDEGVFEKRLRAWREMVAPSGSKVKVWPVRGNHEVYRYPDPKNYDGKPIPDAKTIWKKVFPDLPQNEPKSDDGLSFFAVQDSALIVGLDEYGYITSQPGDSTDEPLKRRHLVNQTWLERVLEQNPKPFTFVYGHEGAFMAGRHADDDTLAADAVARNVFWESLLKARAIYFCGHDHFYDRMSVTRKWTDSPPVGLQITAGTAGAPGYTAGVYADSNFWKLERGAHFENVWGYLLIEVDSDKATITFKAASASNCCPNVQLDFVPKDRIVCDKSGCKPAPLQGQ